MKSSSVIAYLRLALLVGCLASSIPLSGAGILYPGFGSTAGLTLSDDAATVVTADGTVLRLATSTPFSNGSAYSSTLVNAADFSSYFELRFTEPAGISPEGADGIAFVIQSVSASIGSSGGFLGYGGVSPSVAIEFDIFENSWDPDNSHVAVLQNGNVMVHQDLTSVTTPKLQDGAKKYAWVDYDGLLLEFRLSTTPVRPTDALFSTSVDIPSVLGQSTAYIGFSGATGAAYANHDVLWWQLETNFNPISGRPMTAVPEPSSVGLLALGLVGLLAARRRSRT
jgi:hypothetical protein